jgi:hypothetical protein
MISKNFELPLSLKKKNLNQPQIRQNPKDMNALFIQLVAPLTVISFNSSFQKTFNQPILLKQIFSKNIIGYKHLSMIKAAIVLNNFKSSRTEFIEAYLPHNG